MDDVEKFVRVIWQQYPIRRHLQVSLAFGGNAVYRLAAGAVKSGIDTTVMEVGLVPLHHCAGSGGRGEHRHLLEKPICGAGACCLIA